MASLIDTLAGVSGNNPPQPVVATTLVPSVFVIPYSARDDKIADLLLPSLWKQLKEDGIAELYFPGQPETGFADFVALMSGNGTKVALCALPNDRQEPQTIIGFISWTPMKMGLANVAMAGFEFFRAYWDHKTTDEAARAAFEFWFTQTDTEVIMGSCPEMHRMAMRFNQRIGLKRVGIVPMGHIFKGQKCDAVMWAMTKKEWEATCQQQPSR